MKQGKYLNSVEAANLLGVNVSTIKRWTDSGKLKCLQTAGGHRKFLMKHINEYLSKQNNGTEKVSVLPYDSSEHRQINHLVQKHSIGELVPILLNNALQSKRNEVNMIVTGLALAQYPLYKIFDNLLTPVLHTIGEMWENGALAIAEEHIASNIIRDSVLMTRELIINTTESKEKVICMALDDEEHDIPLKMIQILLEQRGFDVYYSGQKTPANSLENLFNNHKPQRLYVSATYFDPNWKQEELKNKDIELKTLYEYSKKYGFDIYVGGRAFNILEYDTKYVKRKLNNFKEVYKY